MASELFLRSARSSASSRLIATEPDPARAAMSESEAALQDGAHSTSSPGRTHDNGGHHLPVALLDALLLLSINASLCARSSWNAMRQLKDRTKVKLRFSSSSSPSVTRQRRTENLVTTSFLLSAIILATVSAVESLTLQMGTSVVVLWWRLETATGDMERINLTLVLFSCISVHSPKAYLKSASRRRGTIPRRI